MLMNSNDYLETVEQIKSEIRAAQYKAAVSANQELILLYHAIGEVINAHKVWGNKFIENLAKDIKTAFPNTKGYSWAIQKFDWSKAELLCQIKSTTHLNHVI